MRRTNLIALSAALLLGIAFAAESAPLPQIEASFSTTEAKSGCKVSCDIDSVLLEDSLLTTQVRKSGVNNVIRTFGEYTEFPELDLGWLEGGSFTLPGPCLGPVADPYADCADPVFGRKLATANDSWRLFFASAEPRDGRAPIVYPYFRYTNDTEQRGDIDLSAYTNGPGPVLDMAASHDLVAISLPDGIYTFRIFLHLIYAPEGPPLPAREGVAGFGETLAMTSEWLAVGAPGRNGHVGAVYVYRLKHRFDDTGTAVPFWELQQMLLPPQDEVQSFGAALAISDNRLIIGAPQYAHGAGRAGLVYVYVLGSDQRWRRHQTLSDPYTPGTQGPFTERRFGTSVALDGTRLMIGVGFGPEQFDSRPLAFLAQEQSDHRFRLTAAFKVSRSVKRVDLSCGSAMALGVTRLGGVAQVYRLPESARGPQCAAP